MWFRHPTGPGIAVISWSCVVGRDAPRMRGWWQAADGTWYPPPHALPPPAPRRPWWFLAGVAGLAVVVVVAVLLSGGDDTDVAVEGTSPGLTQPSTVPPTTGPSDLPVGARTRLQSGATVQVRSYEQGVAGDTVSPPSGRRFDAIEVEGCAPARAPDDGSVVNPFRFVLRLPDDTSIAHGVAVREPAVGFVALGPGECTRGWITFEVTRSARPTAVVYSSPHGDTGLWRLAG